MKKLAAFLVLTVFRRPTVCQSKKCTMKLVLKRLTISDLMTRDEYMGVWSENDCKWWYLWRRKKPEAILAKVSRPHE
jgi:hypothetical protein